MEPKGKNMPYRGKLFDKALEKMAVISTGHISEHTAKLLDKYCNRDSIKGEDQSSVVPRIEKHTHGWLLFLGGYNPVDVYRGMYQAGFDYSFCRLTEYSMNEGVSVLNLDQAGLDINWSKFDW